MWFQIYEEHLNLVGSMQLNDIDGHTNLPGGGLHHSSCHLSPQSKKCGTTEWRSFEITGHDDNNIDCNHLLYLLLAVPYAVYRMAESSVTDPKHFFHKYYFKIAISFVSLNTISNFYVYGLTVPSFREFVKRQMHQSYRSIICITSGVGEIQN